MKSRHMGAVASPEPLSRREICFYVRKTLTAARVLSFITPVTEMAQGEFSWTMVGEVADQEGSENP